MKESLVILSSDVGKKLEDYLKEKFNYSGRKIRKMKYKLNDIKISPIRKIYTTGVLEIFSEEKKTNISPIKMDLDIIYEDDKLLILNKPPYLLTHPTAKKVDKTLANGLVFYFNSKNEDIIPRFYNRLDMNTSGLLVIAKSSHIQYILQKEDTKIIKKYIALVEGIADFDEKIVEKNILHIDGELKRIISEDGQYAKTKFKVLKKYEKLNMSLIECELFTGRTHQIRVHLSSLGFPIVGDILYNENSKLVAPRQFLHSYYLKIENKEENLFIEYKIDIPEDMKVFLIE